jgi:hypothetical protein
MVLKIIKKPRDSPLKDIPISFKPLQNLHLELLEVKDKLKPGLPLIPRSAPKLKIQEEIIEEKKSSVTEESSKSVVKSSKKKKKDKHRHKKHKHHHKKKKDDVLVLELGESSASQVFEEDSGIEQFEEETIEGGSGSADIIEGEEEEGTKKEEEVDIYAGLSPEERLIKEREEYIWRFRILKKQYGRNATIPIPEWNEHSDLGMMKVSYERTIRELYLDDAVENYRTYIMASWIAMEYVATQWMGIDLSGFTLHSCKMMYKYDRMLIELGEKSYSKWGQTIPVEIRLIGMVLFQAAIFYLAKMITEKLGGSVGELFRGFTGMPPANFDDKNEKQQPVSEDSKKMKGPRVKAEDIRKQKEEK